ncbi:MAG: precorrin-3B C(17)-methyltransferase [Anaerolineaceae bacterium]|nr:precorrin-3B C(17)-methyltransferase [Anaerolineaceae bacterium]
MGKLIIAGIGPGDRDSMTIAVDKALDAADIIVGYTVYVDLIKSIYPGKDFFTTSMTREVERCQTALDLARQGKNVVLICSGDSGIYGMAALVYELRGETDTPEVEILPGITAACSGGALLGAPLTHDFAVISLSDRLTPWEKIEARLKAAAEADLSIVLYNPASKSRPDYLSRACDILLQKLPADRPCGVAHAIGREGENCQLMALRKLHDFPADMFCTIFVGNSMTKVLNGKLITPRGYRNV